MSQIFEDWETRLHQKVVGGRILYQAGDTQIVRIVTENSSFICKAFANEQALEREASANQMVVTAVPELHIPKIIATFKSDAGIGWIGYTDDHLFPVSWSTYRTRQAIDLMVDIHNAAPRLLEHGYVHQHGASHTPSHRQILDEIQDFSLSEHVVTKTDLSKHGRQSIVQLHKMLKETEGIQCASTVVCHGDLHLGNILYNLRSKNLYVIDWEFLHIDSPYFDLFQMLDATSPFVSLKTSIRRLDALVHYHRKMEQNRRCVRRESAFIAGYLKYAAAHLMWILQRIVADQADKRFSARQLERQRSETLWRLSGMANAWWELYRNY